MLPQLKMVISESNTELDVVFREIDTRPAKLVNTLEDFQSAVNASITQLIEKQGDLGGNDMDMEEEEAASNDEEEENVPGSPKKKKK